MTFVIKRPYYHLTGHLLDSGNYFVQIDHRTQIHFKDPFFKVKYHRPKDVSYYQNSTRFIASFIFL